MILVCCRRLSTPATLVCDLSVVNYHHHHHHYCRYRCYYQIHLVRMISKVGGDASRGSNA